MNNDIQVTKGWLRKMVEIIDMEGSIGCVIPTQHLPLGRASIVFNDGIVDVEETAYVTGACALFKREVFDQLGLFDESLHRNGQADLDFAIRMRKAGIRTMIAREVYIQHEHSLTLRDLEEYQSGEYQKENYVELKALKNKWGEAEIQVFLQNAWQVYDKERYEREVELLTKELRESKDKRIKGKEERN
jgi:GT2 family glycosyltransferase